MSMVVRRMFQGTAGSISLILALMLLPLTQVGSVLSQPVSTGILAPISANGPRYDPQQAPIIFLPGLIGSELNCTNQSTTTNLWPGVGPNLLDWTVPFAALGLINTLDQSGNLQSQTTSSEACGSTPFYSGVVAENEPDPVSAVWCLPEAEIPTSAIPHPCLVHESVQYSAFGVQLTAQLSRGGRNQPFVVHPWDWRLSPQAQAPALHRIIQEQTKNTGVKVTVIAHSFGNTLFQEWIQYVEAQGEQAGNYVGRFVSVGGPWWNVATAWTHGAYGSIQPSLSGAIISDLIGRDVTRSVFSSSPGLYWLFPRQEYDDFINQNAATADQHWLAAGQGLYSSWIPFDDVDQVVKTAFNYCPQSDLFPCLSENLYTAAQSNLAPTGFNRSGIQDWTSIVGSGQKTPLQICQGCTTWPDGGTDGMVEDDGYISRTRLIRHTNGDGNIPVFSAIQGSDPDHPLGDRVDFYFTCGITHMGLMQNTDILKQVIPYLAGDNRLSHRGVFSTEPCQLSVKISIDVQPGFTSNVIDLNEPGFVPVAILGSDTFDALSVAPGSLILAGAPVTGWWATLDFWHPSRIRDVNGDGYDDVVAVFAIRDLQIQPEATEILLVGETSDGFLLEGRDTIRIIPRAGCSIVVGRWCFPRADPN